MKVLIGGKGRMASLIRDLLVQRGHTVTGMADALDLSELETFAAADMVIDFSHRDNLGWIIDYVRKNNCALVYGTTGLSDGQKQQLSDLSKEYPVFYSANFSYGVAVLQEILKKAVPLLKDTFDMELSETHHNKKADAPSGTAKALLEIMNADHEYEEVYGRSGMCGARKKEIGVHSLRGGTEAGEHTVYFFGDQETITITHHAADRKIFVNGAVRAAEFLEGKPAGMYTMQDLM